MRSVFIFFGLLTAAVVYFMGTRGAVSDRRPLMFITDMDYQPRYDAQAASPFFADGRAMRTPPAGTVAFGGDEYASDAGSPRQNPDLLQADDRYYRGKEGNGWVDQIPIKVDHELLKRGQERYNIYCAVCHGATGNGKGITTQYGMVSVVSFHDPLHGLMPDGEYYNVITNGKGLMAPFASQLKVRDRWAIVAYIRALMRSQNATTADVPEAQRGELKR
jgi:mono/diheme cytochrome c family protein